jgi:hypothetical protein
MYPVGGDIDAPVNELFAPPKVAVKAGVGVPVQHGRVVAPFTQVGITAVPPNT